MKNNIRVTLGIIILVICCIDGFSQGSQSSEQEKVDQLINNLWSLRYGDWGSLREALREIGDPIIEPFIKKLRDEETSGWSQYKIEWHQRRIAWALGEVRTERAVELLIEMVQDRELHDYGRYEAAMALRRIKPKKAVEPLIKVLNDKKSNPPPRYAAAYALGSIQSEKAVPSLIKALSEEDVQMRMGAVYGLGHIGSDKAVDGLMNALKDKDGYIRRLTYPHLIRLLPDRKTEFLIMALKEEDWGAREDSVKVLVEIGEPIFEHLIPLLKDDDNVVRWEAARLLGIIQLERAVGVLIEALKDSDWMVRNEAAVALED